MLDAMDIERLITRLDSLEDRVAGLADQAGDGGWEAGLKIGMGMFWTGDTGDIPTNWGEADGSLKEKADYATLYDLWAGKYDTGGEGADQFRMFDMRRRVVIGRGSSPYDTTGNADTSAAEGDRNPGAHEHVLNFETDSAGATVNAHGAQSTTDNTGHRHTFASGAMNDVAAGSGAESDTESTHEHLTPILEHTVGGHLHTVTDSTDVSASDDAPYMVLIYIVKMK